MRHPYRERPHDPRTEPAAAETALELEVALELLGVLALLRCVVAMARAESPIGEPAFAAALLAASAWRAWSSVHSRRRR